ncbi:MAG: DUF2784 domain-containing protein [Arenicellales bacterium]
MTFDLVVLAHFGFILWVAIGGLLAIARWWLGCLHLPALLWAVLLEWNGWICPLTPLENELRTSVGLPVYHTGFIEHYLVPLIYPEGLTRHIQMALAVALVLANGAAYIYVVRKHFFKRGNRDRYG